MMTELLLLRFNMNEKKQDDEKIMSGTTFSSVTGLFQVQEKKE